MLISPVRIVKRYSELTGEEIADLWQLAQKVGTVVERAFEGTSLTLTIQDGPEAGQTVFHVHIHILPRKKGDFEKNDQVYTEIDNSSKDYIK